MNTKSLSTDIYKISEFIDEIKKDHIDEDEDTLAMGIFGHIGDIFSNQIQNNIMIASEWGNEMFITRSKYERNIITHAIIAKVNDINATPAKMDILFGISERELLNNLVDDKFYIDSETPIYLGDFEFHLDYNIKITRNTSVTTGDNIYIGLYDMSNSNRLSDISNPYLLPPYILNIDNEKYVFIKCKIRQINLNKIYHKIINDDNIENKTFNFPFTSQLADFKILVHPNENTTIELLPLFDGMPLEDPDKKYCYYTYIDSQTIRVSFIRESYEPSLNSNITVLVKTTEGSKGVFKYTEDVIVEPFSDIYSYTNMTFIVKPITDSEYGIDRKSISELKSIVPKAMLSRGSISTSKDLENYFNMLDDKNNKMKFLQKVHNQFERSYYSFMILKDKNDNIIPSNTGDIKIFASEFNGETDDRYTLNPGELFRLDPNTGNIVRDLNNYTDEEILDLEQQGFLYCSPFFIAVNKYPLTVSSYLTLFDRRYLLLFNYINQNSFIQFISTRIKWYRRLLEDSDTYKLEITLNQNTNENRNIVVLDEAGNIIENNMKVIVILYNEDGAALRYVEGEITEFNTSDMSYTFVVPFVTDDTIMVDSTIRITNMNDMNTTTQNTGYIDSTACKASIHVLAKFEENYGLNNLDISIPGLEEYSLCNTYDVDGGLDFFVNFTDIIQTKVDLVPAVDNDFTLKSIPLVKYSYMHNAESIRFLIDYLISKKIYIDDAKELIDDQFGIDVKFFNTYGPSDMFTIGYNKESLDKTNITLKFRIKIQKSAVENIKDLMIAEIKDYIENINEIQEMHISKLTTYLTNKFFDIEYIEFMGINDYDTTYQFIEKIEMDGHYIPEFLNINSKGVDAIPDIQIELV